MPAWAAIASLALGVAAHGAQPATVAGQTYPQKPIRLIIGSAPGSGPDIIARLVADHLYGVWHQRVVVDSRPGVAGIISAELALRAERDGYTWMMLTSQLFVATSVYSNLKFNLDNYQRRFGLPGDRRYPHMDLTDPEVDFAAIARGFGVAAEQVSKPDQIRAAGSFGSAPVRVLTATDHPVSPARQQLWNDMLASLAAEAPDGEQIVVPGSGHLIQDDRPEAVTTTILDLLPR